MTSAPNKDVPPPIDLKTIVQQCADPEDVDDTLVELATKSKAKKLSDFSAMTAADLEDTINRIPPAIKSKLRDALSPYIKQAPPQVQVPPGGPNSGHARQGWRRDLTMERVEPNPGPGNSWSEIRTRFEERKLRAPGEVAKWKSFLDGFAAELATAYPDLLGFDETHVQGLIKKEAVMTSVFGPSAKVAKGFFEDILASFEALPQVQVPPGGPNSGPRSSSAGDILHWINTTVIIGCFLKDDLKVPQEMSAPKCEWPLIVRDEAVLETLKFWLERLMLRQKTNPADRQRNPLVATHSAPGGGKSSFLDMLASLVGTNEIGNWLPIASAGKEMLANILATSVAIMVTYNSSTPFSNNIDGDRPEHGLALRALFSFFYTPASNFQNFAAAFGNNETSLGKALDCVRTALPGTGIFLGIDELIKAAGPPSPLLDRVGIVLAAVGLALNQSEKFNAIVTTLDQGPVLQMLSSSGRLIKWVRLRRPTFVEVLQLFPGELAPLLQRCISDCNGHFRSLEALYCTWKLFETYPRAAAYDDLMDAVFREFPYPSYKLTPDLVYAALKGAVVNLDTKIGAATFRQHIVDGLFLNALSADESAAVPLLSPLILRRWAHTRLATDEGSIPIVAKRILCMMVLTPNFTWQQYEMFHAHWEVMRRAIFQDGETVSLLSFYTPATFIDLDKHLVSSVPNNLTFTVHHKKGVKQLTGHYRTCATSEKDPEMVCLPAAGNPGFDVVSLEKTPTAQTLAICVECRFSQPGAKTPLSLVTVQSKREFTLAEMESSSLDQVVLVVCAFRRLHSDWYKEGAPASKKPRTSRDVAPPRRSTCVKRTLHDLPKDGDHGYETESDDEEEDLHYDSSKIAQGTILYSPPANTLVLDRNALQALYTPSLVSLPQFMLEDVVVK
jgi:hypothetical protein